VCRAKQAFITLAKQTLPSNGETKMSNFVFVLDTNKQSLAPIHPSAARRLLNARKAAVYRTYPFTIILNSEVTQDPTPVTLKLDPGSRTTGMALVRADKAIWAAELTHRGLAIKAALDSRRSIRRNRRARNTRYCKARFLNRSRPKGWLAPSLQHRVETTLTWVGKLIRLVSIGSIVSELVRFDLQQLENPEISGIQYQQGTLLGYEVREYLLNKWDRKCTYCAAENVPLQVEHIQSKAQGGSNRISNLCLACEKCNQIKCQGHGNRQMCGTDKYGFPSRHRTHKKFYFGFQTGDIVRVIVTSGKKIGSYVGRLLCRASGSFDLAAKSERVTVSDIIEKLGLKPRASSTALQYALTSSS
jgi:5-methylcytosine-specific restriction endonuclease McrA